MCTSNKVCLLIWIDQNSCYLYDKVDYSNFVSSPNTATLMEKFVPNYSSITSYMTNKWNFNNNFIDQISAANMFGGVGSISFTKDRLNRNSAALYLNQVMVMKFLQ